jgi:exopolyphosphatase/guanosine-5'-triphosphate,3'-diphosphate pyrophosphatase
VSGPVAAVDCGSNSTRLLVVGPDGDVRARELRITRLSAGVDASGRLDPDALGRTLDVLGEYRELWERTGVTDRVRIAATSAVRDAVNRDDFFRGVRDVTGVDAEVLSGDDEARLSFAGAVKAVEVTFPVALVDIGGGSTEIVVGDRGGVSGAFSMQLGSVRVTERHLHGDPATPAEIAAAREMIAGALDGASRRFAQDGVDPRSAATLVGVAGTVTTLAALHLGVDGYDPDRVHGSRLSADDVAGWSDRLLGMTTSDRAAEPTIPAGREDVIHAGVLILAEVMDRYGFGSVVVSEADILDGLAASLRSVGGP